MYEPLLLIHSWTRWIVLVAGVFLIIRYFRAAIEGRAWNSADGHFLWAFDQSFGYQFLFGLTIWLGMSPWSKAMFRDFGSVGQNPLVFFWGVRHPLTMLVAIGLFHGLKARAKRRPDPERFRFLAWTLVAVLAVLLTAIPWPWMDVGRALFRGLP